MQVNKQNIDFVKSNFTKLQQKLRDKDSRAENRFAELLSLAGIYYFREKCNFHKGTRWCYYDFLIPGYNILVEIDGDEHSTPEQIAIDEEKEILVKNQKYRVVRFTNREVFNMSSIGLMDIVHRLKSKEHRTPLKYFDQWAKVRNHHYFHLKRVRKNRFGNDIFTGPVYLYNRETNCFYRFETAFDLHFSTDIPLSSCLSDLDRTLYAKTKRRKYIVSRSPENCIKWSAYMWNDDNILENSITKTFIIIHPAVEFLQRLMKDEKLRKRNRVQRK